MRVATFVAGLYVLLCMTQPTSPHAGVERRAELVRLCQTYMLWSRTYGNGERFDGLDRHCVLPERWQ